MSQLSIAPSTDLATALCTSYPALQLWPNLARVSVPQAALLLDDRLEVFYGGAAGGGKSDALLAGALQYADVPGYAALIVRRTFSDMQPHVEHVTCRKPTAKTAEERAAVYARRWVDRHRAN